MHNLDEDKYGVVAAFSINSDNQETIMNNAIKSISESELFKVAQVVYLVGVTC